MSDPATTAAKACPIPARPKRIPPKADMRVHVREQAELAAIYAEDGAYQTALRVLMDLTEDVRAHVERLRSEGLI